MMPTNPFDARISFYLKHRKVIEEWVALRYDTSAAADGFFKGLEPDLIERARKLDGAPSVTADWKSGYRKFFLQRPGWLNDAGSAAVAIALEWTKRGGFTNIYSGVWLNRDDGTALAMDPSIRSAVEALAPTTEYKKSVWWPAYKYFAPSEERFWENGEQYRTDLLQHVEDTWSTFWKAVDAAVTKWRASNGGSPVGIVS